MDRLISLDPSNLVVIRVEQGQKCRGEVTLRNLMHTMPVAYKFQLMNQTRFNICPQMGIIAPLSTIKVEIIYLLSSIMYIPESATDCDNWIQLLSVVVPSAIGSNYNRIEREWFTNKKKQVFVDCGLEVILVGPQILAGLISKGSLNEIRELLEISDSNWKLVDSIVENGQRLLHLAIAQSRADNVQLLLELGSDVEARNQSGISPLESAVAAGEEVIVELLLAHNASPEKHKGSAAGPIHYASWAGYLEILRMILLHGARIDARTRNGETALHLAGKNQRSECVELLMASGAKTDFQTRLLGETPLHVATEHGDEQMVKLLIRKGAEKDVRNRFGKMAYEIALKKGFVELLDTLRVRDGLLSVARKGGEEEIQRVIEEGATISDSDQNGWTALHWASSKGKFNVVKILVVKGINVNEKDEEGYTALHCAVEAGHADVARYLLERGALLGAKTKKGVTPLQISKSLGYLGITNILENKIKQHL